MKVLLDLNVLLDVVQQREPFYDASAAVLSLVIQGELSACIPAHALTTIHYIVARYGTSQQADDVIDWLLAHLEVVPEGWGEFRRARGLTMADFEDAVTASAAETAACDVIISRNIPDFEASPVPAITPEEFLSQH